MNAGTTIYYPLPYELAISSNISSVVGADFIKSNTGGLLLSGNNSGLAGDLLVEAGILGFGNTTGNNALGTGMVGLSSGVALEVENGPQTLNNNFQLDGDVYLEGGIDGASASAAYWYDGGAANNLTINGNITWDGANATVNLWTLSPAIITTNGAVGEQNVACSIVKEGPGIWQANAPILIQGSISIGGSPVGATTAGDGGALILGGAAGAIPNASGVTILSAGVLQIDNSTSNQPDRLRATTTLTMSGSSDLVFIGMAGQDTTETIGTLATKGNFGQRVILQPGVGGSLAVTASSLTYAASNPFYNASANSMDSMINFIGLGAALGNPANQLMFKTPPATIGGVLNWAFLTNYTYTSGQQNARLLRPERLQRNDFGRRVRQL